MAENAQGSDTAQTEQTEPKYITADEFDKRLNAALSNRDKRLEKSLMASITSSIQSLLKPQQADQSGESDAAPQPTSQGPSTKTTDPEVVRLRQLMEQTKKQLDAETKKREEAEAKARDERITSSLRDAYIKAGVRPEAVDILVKANRTSVTFDDDGNPIMPLDEGGTSTVDAAVGVWAKGPTAAMFLPAPTQGGGGTQRVPRGTVSTDWQGKPPAQMTDADRSAALAAITQTNAQRGY